LSRRPTWVVARQAMRPSRNPVAVSPPRVVPLVSCREAMAYWRYLLVQVRQVLSNRRAVSQLPGRGRMGFMHFQFPVMRLLPRGVAGRLPRVARMRAAFVLNPRMVTL